MMEAIEPGQTGKRRERLIFISAALLLLVALLLRTYDLDGVPPGVHYDEILNAEMAELALRDGPRIFYDSGGGREGLYHLFLAASLSLPLPLAWQLRLPSVMLGMITVVFSGLWVSRAFGRPVGLMTLGLMAAAFWTVWIGRVALRATTVPPVAAIAAYLLLRLLYDRSISRWQQTLLAVSCGGIVGLSFYTYRAGSMIILLFFLFALYLLLWHREQARKLWLPLVVALLVGAPIIWLMATQPEIDPRFAQVALPWQALLRGDAGPVLQGVAANLGMFFWQGDLDSHYNLPGRPLFEPLGAVFFVVGLAVAALRWRQPPYAFCLLWLAVGIVPGIFTVPAPSFVHTVTAQGVVYIFPAIAVQGLYRRIAARNRRRATSVSSALVAVLLAVTFYGTVVDYFMRWPMVEEVRAFHQADLALAARDIDTLAAEPVAVCSSVLNEDDSFWRSGRQSLRFMMRGDTTRVRWYDCAAAQVMPAARRAHLYFPNEAQPNDWLGLQPAGERESLALAPGVTRITLDGAQWQERLLQRLAQQGHVIQPVQFGGDISFLGYYLSAPEVAAGNEVTLLTTWRVLSPMPGDRSVFVHVLAPDGGLAAQGDALSLLSDTLQAGDMVIQRHRFTIRQGTPAGAYAISVGVYSRRGAHPPLVITHGAATRDARLELTTLTVHTP